MYDLDPGRPAWVLTQNENLLDNWYFVGGGSQQGGGQFPINQRGQASYTGGVYGIDRWKSNRTTTTVTVKSNGIQFSDSNTNQGGIRQSLETDFQNKTVTLSLLVLEVTGGVRVWARNNSNFASYGTNTITSPGLVTVTATIPSGYPGNFCFYIDGDVGMLSPVSATILAAKLELGTRSTLARLVDGEWVLNDPPPNFQQELAKCQRYFVRYSYPSSGVVGIIARSASWDRLPVPIPVPMRAKPSISLSTETLLNVIDTRTSLPTPTIVDTPGTSLVLGFTHTGDSLDATYVYASVSGYIDFSADL